MDDADRTERGRSFAEAVQTEIERLGVADELSATFLPGENLVRITCARPSGSMRCLEYPSSLESMRPILEFLRVEARLAGMRHAREQQFGPTEAIPAATPRPAPARGRRAAADH